MFRVTSPLRAKVQKVKQLTDVTYSAPVNTKQFIDLRKVSSRWEFMKPIYQNIRRGDFVYVRYYTDYEFCQRFEGIVTQVRRKNYASSFVLLNPESGISQRMFFFAPTILFAEIKKPTSDDLMWTYGKERQNRKRKVTPAAPPKIPQTAPNWYKPEEAILINAQTEKTSSSTQAVQQQ